MKNYTSKKKLVPFTNLVINLLNSINKIHGFFALCIAATLTYIVPLNVCLHIYDYHRIPSMLCGALITIVAVIVAILLSKRLPNKLTWEGHLLLSLLISIAIILPIY